MTLRNFLITIPRSRVIRVNMVGGHESSFFYCGDLLTVPAWRWITETEVLNVIHRPVENETVVWVLPYYPAR